MDITVNGEKMRVEGEITVARLLEILDLEPRKIAVERNLEIVSKSRFCETFVSNGDRLEIVQFVGGG